MSTLNYRSFSQLMAEASQDLEKYSDNGLIKNSRYINTVRRVNSDLGLRINQKDEAYLTIQDYKTDSPDGLLSIFSAFALDEYEVGTLSPAINGTHTTVETKMETFNKQPNIWAPGCINKDGGGCYWVTRTSQNEKLEQCYITPLVPSQRSLKWFDKNSPNRCWTQYEFTVDVVAGEINVNFCDGEIYIQYVKDMVDEEGNLLVLEHPLTNDYYLWAVKEKILQDLYYNKDADVANLLQDARVQLGKWRQEALTIVATPEYKQLKDYNKNILMDFYINNFRGIV